MPAKGKDGRYEPLVDSTRLRVQAALDANKKLIYLDEVIFTHNTNIMKEWSARTKNLVIPSEQYG